MKINRLSLSLPTEYEDKGMHGLESAQTFTWYKLVDGRRLGYHFMCSTQLKSVLIEHTWHPSTNYATILQSKPLTDAKSHIAQQIPVLFQQYKRK